MRFGLCLGWRFLCRGFSFLIRKRVGAFHTNFEAGFDLGVQSQLDVVIAHCADRFLEVNLAAIELDFKLLVELLDDVRRGD